MAITNAQQYQQLVNKPANGKRPGYAGRNPQASFDYHRENKSKLSEQSKADLKSMREGLNESIRESGRDDFIDKLTDVIPVVSTIKRLSKLLPQDTVSNYYDTNVLPYLKRNPKMNQLTKDQYIRLRTMGEVDAMGRPINTNDDDDNQMYLPESMNNTQNGNENETDTEQDLSAIEEAILKRGDASAFFNTGGRVGFKGGADMGTVSTPTRQATAKSVNVSPGGSVTTSTTKEPDEVDRRRTTPDQNLTQYLVNQGLSPSKIRKEVNPNLIDRTIKKAKDSYDDLSPVSKGILKAGFYTANPSIGGLDEIGRKIFKVKNIIDTTKELKDIFSVLPSGTKKFDEDDENELMSNLITDKQKQIIDNDMKKFGDVFNPDATFKSAKIFDDPGETKTFGFLGENRPAEPMTREEFDAYVRENRAGGGPVGGIMDLESGRQMYFLGKLVKKATRAVKKIVKSPVGKAALLYFGGQALTSGGLGTFLKTKAAPFLFNEGKAFGKGNIGFLDMLKGGLSGGGKFALGSGLTLAPLLFQQEEEEPQFANSQGAKFPDTIPNIRDNYRKYMARAFVADGGIMRAGYEEGGDAEPVAKKTMPLLDMDGMEKDYRADGGFVPIGRMERADDVPARLSKNEFVFTADAVRNAGEGDIDKGADVMYNMMKNLEAGGEVSEESQGLEGAREMFKTSQRLEEVI